MNSKVILLVILFLLSVQQLTYAGFATTSSVATNKHGVVVLQHHSSAVSVLNRKIAQVKSVFHPDREVKKDGTVGRLSFVFGFCGFIPLVGALFSIAAMILGGIGLKKHQKHSLAGLILGAGTLTLGIIITVLILASI